MVKTTISTKRTKTSRIAGIALFLDFLVLNLAYSERRERSVRKRGARDFNNYVLFIQFRSHPTYLFYFYYLMAVER